MRYMLMMHTPKGNGDYNVSSWPAGRLTAHVQFMHQLNAELVSNGELVVAEGLAPPGQAKLVSAGSDGVPNTDGVFPESKEFLAGFWIVDVDTAQRAYDIAGRASTAPGPDGEPLRLKVEVRQVMQAPPTE